MRRHGWTRAATVFVVAYGLVVQALFGAIAGSSDFGASLWLDAGIICSEHGTAPGTPESGGSGAHHGTQCCILHAAGLDPVAGPPAATPFVSPRIPVAGTTARPILVEILPRPHGVRPLGARAPPVPV